MTDNSNSSSRDYYWRKGMKHDSIFGGVYGLAFIGAAFYFIQHSTTFWMGVLGLLKAIVWPAVIMYQILGMLKL